MSPGISGLVVPNMECFVSAVISIDVTTEILIKISCQNKSSRIEYRTSSAFPLPPASACGGLSFLLTKYLCNSEKQGRDSERCITDPLCSNFGLVPTCLGAKGLLRLDSQRSGCLSLVDRLHARSCGTVQTERAPRLW